MNLVAGQYALVTGGGTGIGFGIARRLLEEGAARVTIAGRRLDVLEDAVSRLLAFVPNADVGVQVCDITQEDQVAAAVTAACGPQGQLDILVANAGSGFPGPILEASADAWRFCCELNVIGTVLCIKHAAQAMKAKGGSIVTISSTSGLYHDQWMAPYGATKAAVNHLTKSAAVELARFNIRVNAIAPGFVPTEATSGSFSEELARSCIERSLTKRGGEPEEIGDAAVFLASDMGRWITGQIIGVDGGLSVHIGSDFAEIAKMVVGDAAMANAGYEG